MLGKSVLVLTWFPLTIILLIVNLALLSATMKSQTVVKQIFPDPFPRHITASAGTAQVLGTSIVAGDARTLIIENYLKKFGSPLAPFANLIVKEADANGLDFRLVVAIAMCESNLGKKIPTHDSFNAYGIAVYTGSQSGKKFSDWNHSISWVSNYIKTFYYDRGITKLTDIGAIWAPPTEASNHAWSACVSQFQDSIL